MNALLVGIVIAAALMHAGWNAILKSGNDRVWSMFVMQVTMAAAAVLAVPFLPLPAPESWPWLVGGAVLHTAFRAALVHAFGYGELAEIYTISRGASPVIVTIGAALVAGDRPGILTLLGIFLICGGIVGMRRSGARALPRTALIAGLVLAALTAGYTVVDGVGARLSGAALAFIAWLYVLGAVGTAIWTLAVRRGLAVPPFAETRQSIYGGLVAMTAYGIVIWASTRGDMGAISALRETSVVFAALIGHLFLNERLTTQRLIACTTVAVGCACITL